MREGRWCDFQWDPQTFPDPPAMLARMKSKGLRICVWINPYIAQESALYAEGVRRGFLLRRTDGTIYQWDDGSDPAAMHNRYALLYNQAVYEVLAEEKGRDQAVLFARASTAGGQQYPVHWGGDSNATFESMAETLRGGLSLGLCGFGFWSHDISGFENTATPELYKRWAAFGLLSSHSRLHGSGTLRVPWAFDEEACRVLRRFVRLKCLLMPYIWGRAVEATRTGLPLLRHMLLEFPDDPACRYLDRQYMLGDRLLVAPVFDPEGWCEYYLPAGQWTGLLDGRVVDGGRWFRERFDAFSLPLWVREGSVLPIGNTADRPDYDFRRDLTLVPFALPAGQSARLVVPGPTGQDEAVFDVRVDAHGKASVDFKGAPTLCVVRSLTELNLESRLGR
jgi:alpha-D-xyloside xylohydrolase